MSAAWRHFCIVGLGGHARTKLIPAILANGQTLAGIVSGKSDAAELGAPVFASVELALETLPADTVFVIASPPTAHFAQAEPVLAAGRDVIVEKPAFVTAAEAVQAAAVACRADAVFVEAYMNRLTETHRHYVEACAARRPASMAFRFTIPQAPIGTFRADRAVGASNLYDIGAYVLSALLDIGLPLADLHLQRADHAGRPDQERLHLSGILDGVEITALVGIDVGYENRLRLSWSDANAIEYVPFFYGRPTRREILITSAGKTRRGFIEDVNAFQALFAVPRSEWQATQAQRLDRMVELTRQLERLGRELAAARAAAQP